MNEEKIVMQNQVLPQQSQPVQSNRSMNIQNEMIMMGGRGYWRNGLSIDETKVSILIICLLIFVGLALFLFIKAGDIPITLVTLITAFVWGVAGINAASSLSSFLSNSFGGSSYSSYGTNSYGSNYGSAYNNSSYGTTYSNSNNYGTNYSNGYDSNYGMSTNTASTNNVTDNAISSNVPTNNK